MKIGIKYRLFLSILAATCLALFCMFLIMQWSINRGFLQYLNDLDQSRLEQIAGNLGKAYSEHGSWDFLRKNPRLLTERLMNMDIGDVSSERFKELNKRKDIPHFPPPLEGAHQPRLPFIVLDAERNPLFGNPVEAKDINLRPIAHNNKTGGLYRAFAAKTLP